MNKFPNKNQKYDLEERTAKFGENIIGFCKDLQKNNLNKSIVNQLIRSGTSTGANYMEANGASSKKDFCNKIFICKKECQETKYWLRMTSQTNPEAVQMARILYKEAHELNLIFHKIAQTTRKGKNKNLEIEN